MTGTWPPVLADLKTDMGISADHTDEDTNLSSDLASAVAYVQRVRPTFNYDQDPLNEDCAPTDDLWNGTLAYARRLFTRRRSPDGLVDMGDLGQGRVPTVDRDIDRLLGIGNYAEGLFA